MNKKYKEYPNYIKIEELETKEWKLSGTQLNLLMQLSKEISVNERHLIDSLGEQNIIPIFLKQLLFFEQNRNSNIEGSQTQFDELFDIDRNFGDFMSWETRNLMDASLELFSDIRKDLFSFNVDSIINLHKKLYMLDKNKMNIDSNKYIQRIKPGYILTDGDPINWIGRKTNDREKDLMDAILIPVVPEDKKDALEKLVKDIREKIDQNSLSILDISRFHVIFEGIHPFADGNGRLGRLLVLALMQIANITNFTILPFSEVIYLEKDKYIEKLNAAQVSGDIDLWNSYFLDVLISAKKVHERIIKRSIDILNNYSHLKTKANKYKVFLKFFKHIKLKKDLTVNKLTQEGMSQPTAYRLFEEVAKELNVSRDGEFYVFDTMWNIYKGE